MNIPEDLIIDILSRLPVTSLLRFKCVCRSWNIIINDPAFIAKHQQTHHSEVALVSRRDNATNRRVISLVTTNDALIDLNLPSFLNEMFGHVRMIGPCHGIVCLYGFPDNIALWNPITRDFKRLPQSRVPRPPNSKVRGGDLGVGFDPKARDFKVLQMLFCVPSNDYQILVQVEIYSSKSDSWKKFDSHVPANIMYYNLWSMVFKNENFCWWAQDSNNYHEVILSFNMSNEMFRTTPLPPGIESVGGDRRVTRAILPMKESLALIVYGQRDVDKVFHIWTVKELGSDGECWSRMRSIGPVSRVEKPLGFWGKNGIFLENSDGEMVLYDNVHRSIKNFEVYGKRSRLEVIVLKEGLFSVS